MFAASGWQGRHARAGKCTQTSVRIISRTALAMGPRKINLDLPPRAFNIIIFELLLIHQSSTYIQRKKNNQPKTISEYDMGTARNFSKTTGIFETCISRSFVSNVIQI